MWKLFISSFLLLSFSANLFAEWEGIAYKGDNSNYSNQELCLDTFSPPCDCPEDEECPGEDCQDCHCHHTHLRYLVQNISIKVANPISYISPLGHVGTFYIPPFIESNRRPPKYQPPVI